MSALPCGKDLRMDENPATSVQPCEEASQRVVLLDGRPNRACRRVLLAVVGGTRKPVRPVSLQRLGIRLSGPLERREAAGAIVR